MSALPRPDLPAGPRRDLVEALHDLHHRAGWPSLRTLARQTGVSHTTVSKVFSTSALPTWGTVELLVAAMGGDTQQFHGLWLAASTPSDSTAPPTLRIAGRRAELAAVRRHMEIGSGLLLVTGEAGIGKTTLVTTAARTAMSFVAVGHCLPLSTEAPLMPVIDVLSALQEVDAGTWVEEALANAPAHVASSVARLLPSLGGHQTESRRDEFAHQHLLASLAHLLSSLAAARPVALLVEDLHWSDLTTLDLLEHQLSRGGGPPVVATWREENSGTTPDQQGWLDRIQRLPTTEVVGLGELSREDTFEQLRLMDGGTPDPDRAERVYARSLGHPLFTEHLARQRGQDLSVPRHLSEMLQHRFVGIGPSTTAVAATLAVADRGLPSDVLTEVGARPDERRRSAARACRLRFVADRDRGCQAAAPVAGRGRAESHGSRGIGRLRHGALRPRSRDDLSRIQQRSQSTGATPGTSGKRSAGGSSPPGRRMTARLPGPRHSSGCGRSSSSPPCPTPASTRSERVSRPSTPASSAATSRRASM